jgi:hypothetical protein
MHPEVAVSRRCCGIGESHRKRILYRTIQMIMSSSYQNSSVKRVSELDSRRARTACDGPACQPLDRTAAPGEVSSG